MKKIAVVPGSFDPITSGHEDLVRRAASLFGKAQLLIMTNGAKNSFFDVSERLEIASAAFEGEKNISVNVCKGLLCDYARLKDAVIIKGARNGTDFDYEFELYEINRTLEDCETVILPAKKELQFISSTFVRELIRFGRPLEPYVPAASARVIAKILAEK
ncbi:MAG: pantetheine-phosphate adenylyltransferase [Clostridia bacterium]|nr:pantetheine-phosphate adenylyltransferase [Clostridia bacterium]